MGISCSSRMAVNIKLSGTVGVKGTGAPVPEDLSKLPSYVSGKIAQVGDEEFEALLGHEIPDGHWSGTLHLNDAICQLYYAKSFKARFVYKILTGMLNKSISKGEPDLNIIFIYNMPFRAIGKMAGGMISQELCEGIMTIVNGHGIAFIQSLGRIISAFLRQQKVQKKAKSFK